MGLDSPTDATSILKSKRVYMKGASQLESKEKKFYDIKVIVDPRAKASKKMGKAGNVVTSEGDGDVWVEKIFRHRESGEKRIIFVSKQTGKKSHKEPPTGASTVLYLRQSYKDHNELEMSPSSAHDRKNDASGVSGNVSPNYTDDSWRRKQRSFIPCKGAEDQTI
mmetsp:Transcript_6282/g.7305  ORF Transcript_6282/g.7305 Transcript_6282/m.7305 type:complete len:165 (+) Transcript_6282:189-683(+)|eukprot:CAMPEP_0198263394 /NCGR_PEP_ID=MMETSP1447-20131203/11728_1 /TAXON_ID=420782 /ORGANISM="Chaetoceros dichaeta, Strain CCMP1751" /LENGTH=164 /DNA_ID=CAMNT_0043951955 /DNA_START=130 /DNA_END=624 /DNA_ORIENTATION=+